MLLEKKELMQKPRHHPDAEAHAQTRALHLHVHQLAPACGRDSLRRAPQE